MSSLLHARSVHRSIILALFFGWGLQALLPVVDASSGMPMTAWQPRNARAQNSLTTIAIPDSRDPIVSTTAADAFVSATAAVAAATAATAAAKAAGVASGVLLLASKAPHWDDTLKGNVLNFGGRVVTASVKNFQLVHLLAEPPHPEAAGGTGGDAGGESIVLQFGRAEAQETFLLDFKVRLF